LIDRKDHRVSLRRLKYLLRFIQHFND